MSLTLVEVLFVTIVVLAAVGGITGIIMASITLLELRQLRKKTRDYEGDERRPTPEDVW